MSNENNIFFKPLNDDEKKSKLSQLVNGKSSNQITIWKKGEASKFEVRAAEFSRAKLELRISGEYPKEFSGQVLLLTFELNGMHFFGKCKLIFADIKNSFLLIKDELFKSERRNNFRLLTYPHHDVYININIGEDEIKKSNVLNLKTGQSQTSLFKNFLNIMDDVKEDTVKELEGYLSFRVIDISVTGLAFQFGKVEQSFFKELNKDLGVLYLDFNGEMIKIPNAKVLYVIDKMTSNSKVSLFKAGTQFVDVDTNLDEFLAKKINETLRSSEAEFEDFIK